MALPLSNVSPTSSSNSGATIIPPNGSQILASRVSNLPKGFSPGILGTSSSPLAVKVKAHTLAPPLASTHLFAKTNDWITRNVLFGQLEEALLPKLSGEKPLIVKVLHGAGGMGKSELALRFCYEHKNKFSFIWCLDYGSETSLKDQYGQLANGIGIPSSQEEPFEKIRSLVNLKLENWDGPPWLLVLDNVEKLMHPDELPTRGGSILMTAQDSEVWDGGSVIPVDTFSLEEAVTLIHQITGEKESDEIKQLAEEWGLLPFAIHQVARYIKTRKMSITNYRTLYPNPLQGATSPQQKYKKAFQMVWTPALEKLQEEHPLALEWLELSAYLAPRGIPERLIGTWLKEKEGVNSEQQLPEIRFHLEKFALAIFSEETKTYNMHQLFQSVLRERGDRKTGLHALFKVFDKVWEFNQNSSDTWGEASELIPHLRALIKHAEEENLEEETAYWLLEASDYARVVDGDYKKAIELSIRAKASLETIHFPKNSENYVRTLMSLGLSYHELGELEEAENLYMQAAPLVEQLPPGTRSIALPSLCQNLGEFYHDTGSLDEAVSFHQLGVDVSRAIESDIHLVKNLSNLGHAQIEGGEIDPARHTFEEALAIVNKMAKSERDPLLPSLKIGIASIHFKKNEKPLGIKEAEKAIKIQETLSHPKHPEVAKLKKLYADFLLESGDLNGALALLVEVETIFKETYGEESGKLIDPLISKGEVLRRQRHFDDARATFTQALNHIEADYSHRITLYNNLGEIEADLEQWEKARDYYQLACRQLPEEEGNPYLIVNPLINVGSVLIELKQPQEGIKALERAFAILKSVDPEEDHEEFCRIFQFLGAAYFDDKKFLTSAENYEKVIERIKTASSEEDLIELSTTYRSLGSAHFESHVAEAKNRAADAWKKGLAVADRIENDKARGKQRSELASHLMTYIGTPFRELVYPFTYLEAR